MDGTRRLAYPQYWYRVPLEFAAWYEEAFGLPELEDWYEEAFGREMAAQIRWHIHMMRMLWAATGFGGYGPLAQELICSHNRTYWA